VLIPLVLMISILFFGVIMGHMKALEFFLLPFENAEQRTTATGRNLPICKADVSW